MKTTMKAATIASILTIGLTTSIWAAPASKLSHEAGNTTGQGMGSGSGHSEHVLIKHAGPRSKM